MGQVVLLSGEAGLGKSRVVQVLTDPVADAPSTRLACRSSPYDQHTALSPLTTLLHRLLQWQPDDPPEARLEKLERMLRQYRLAQQDTVPLFALLLSLPLPADRYPPLPLSSPRQRQQTLEALGTMLLEQAAHQPVLFILEDRHWTDPSTLEWLDLLLAQTPTAALLTCRPEFTPPWGLRTSLTPVALPRLTRPQIATMVERLTGGKTLPAEVMQYLVEKTDGVPLYIEEMTKAVLETGAVYAPPERYELTGSLADFAIPMTLPDSLMARRDRLGPAKGMAQLGATIGRQFDHTLLRVVSPVDEEPVQGELRRLVEAELVYQRGVPPQATYRFKQALIQDAAYQSLLRSTRQQYHQRIAQALVAGFPETAETQPELVAQHYTEAGRREQAIAYWQRAGQQALQRSANLEAGRHLITALELLAILPETSARAQQELALQLALWGRR
jgi:predicted ATPase